ncbi:RRM domain-containing protein [Heracleum sosnowskyi]|uniref:RRM domain-containing protein n=1 Tax=Heracleum sosnowskyi TaxID=360622 RepID=A0AAD8MKI9_9APIA|nr:RRM domain-containing protein [Heracleum sosnowskyi]
MEPSAEAKYAAFKEKVKRTVYLENLNPQLTDAVIRTALNQFGNVVNIQFVPNFGLENIRYAALVEMGDAKQANQIITEIANNPFMISGKPRPVRAFAAEIEMFPFHPRKPGGKVPWVWLDKKDPDFEVAQKIKDTVLKHASEASSLFQQQLLEEEKTHKRQAETLKANYKKKLLRHKYVILDKGAVKLAEHSVK